MTLLEKIKKINQIYGIKVYEDSYHSKYTLFSMTFHLFKAPHEAIRIFSINGVVIINNDEEVTGNEAVIETFNRMAKIIGEDIKLEQTDINKKWREAL